MTDFLRHGRLTDLPEQGMGSNPIREQLIDSITVMPILHKWTYLARHVIVHRVHFWVGPLIPLLPLQPAQHLLTLWKLDSREDASSWIPDWFLSIIKPWCAEIGFYHLVLAGNQTERQVFGGNSEISLTSSSFGGSPYLALRFLLRPLLLLGGELSSQTGNPPSNSLIFLNWVRRQ